MSVVSLMNLLSASANYSHNEMCVSSFSCITDHNKESPFVKISTFFFLLFFCTFYGVLYKKKTIAKYF